MAFEPEIAKFKSLKANISEILSESEPNFSQANFQDKVDWGFLKFEFEVNQLDYLCPALIVDGQHRFYGMSDYENENLPILIVCLLDASSQEQAFQFIIINNKAVRVPPENVKTIIANFNEEDLKKRLLKAGVSYGKQTPVLLDINDLITSPFHNLLDWSYNKSGEEARIVSLTAIEQSIKYLKIQFDFLEKDDDTDSLVEIFCAVWRSMKTNYTELWYNKSKFLSKVNIIALNEFIVDRLKFAWEFDMIDIYEPTEIEFGVSKIINPKVMPSEFWEFQWSIKIQDNASVRKIIKNDLEQMAMNYKRKSSWDEDLKLPMFSSESSDEENELDSMNK